MSQPLEQHLIRGSHYGFSATSIGDLGAAEYTLVAIAADVSGSVDSFMPDIERCIREVVTACRQSPRADNLMLRLTAFDQQVTEVHGFKPLSACHTGDYDGCLRPGGTTALVDAAHNAIAALAGYGQDLTDHDFDVNGIVFVITDGLDNASRDTPKSIAQAVKATRQREALESLLTILVGVNIHEASVSVGLAKLEKTAGFDRYLEIDQADAQSLVKLADFVSRSIAAQSQALGSGTASPTLSF
jgi:uncharacterized protein YegL